MSLLALVLLFDTKASNTNGDCNSKLHATLLAILPQSQQETECDKLLQAVEVSCVEHVNRHVRVAGLSALDRIICNCPSYFITQDRRLFELLNHVLSVSLADNWSQVHMSASVLCRTLFVALKDDPDKKKLFYCKVLPRMCLN